MKQFSSNDETRLHHIYYLKVRVPCILPIFHSCHTLIRAATVRLPGKTVTAIFWRGFHTRKTVTAVFCRGLNRNRLAVTQRIMKAKNPDSKPSPHFHTKPKHSLRNTVPAKPCTIKFSNLFDCDKSERDRGLLQLLLKN